MPNDEWVELFNIGDEPVDLCGGYICDSTTHNTVTGQDNINKCKSFATSTNQNIIQPHSWFLFSVPTQNGYFNNTSEDEVILKNPDGEDVDKIIYNTSTLKIKKDTESVGRNIDGGGVWQIFTLPHLIPTIFWRL